jgi:hypothetical protein
VTLNRIRKKTAGEIAERIFNLQSELESKLRADVTAAPPETA